MLKVKANLFIFWIIWSAVAVIILQWIRKQDITKHSCWHRCLLLCGLYMGGNRQSPITSAKHDVTMPFVLCLVY